MEISLKRLETRLKKAAPWPKASNQSYFYILSVHHAYASLQLTRRAGVDWMIPFLQNARSVPCNPLVAYKSPALLVL